MKKLELRANGVALRLDDFATATREYRNLRQDKMRYDGKQVIGLGISMKEGWDIIELGKTCTPRLAASRPSCRSASFQCLPSMR